MAVDKKKKEARPSKASVPMPKGAPAAVVLGMRGLMLLAVFGGGHALAQGGAFESQVEGKMSIWARVIFFIVAQSTATEFFALLALQVARRLLGEPHVPSEPTAKERAVHDTSIPWPQEEVLSDELKAFASRCRRPSQPFFLNHVPGRRRCKDACMRFGMMLGSLLSVWCTCRWMDKRSLSALGLSLDAPFWRETAVGLAVGVAIVTFTFVVELALGWIHFLQLFEVFDRTESFARCILWDVIFHLNVALNEELPVRGWLLHNLAEAFRAHLALSANWAFLLAMMAESAFFVVMHLQSPGGAEIQSMLNIFMGGMAGGLNVLCTGGRLGFALGWHFGWNISMGNVFGLSTSGIPISATFISVAPHPLKAKLHGGVFGPEGGVVSPVAYALGMLLLVLIYGLPQQGIA